MTETLAAGSINTSIYVTPHTGHPELDPEPALLAILQKAKKKIRFSTYSFTLANIAEALIAAHLKGLDVLGVGDANEWSIANSQYAGLLAAGVPLKQWGSEWRLNHEKVAVVDDDVVVLGSFNWTTQAETENNEVLVVMSGIQVSRVLAPTLTAQIEAAYAAGIVPTA